MKRKNTILTIAILICVLACLFVFCVRAFNLNIIKHHEVQIGDFTINYWGDFKNVRSISIYENGVRRGSFDISIDKNVIEAANEVPPYLDDLNGDGHDDILIPHSIGENFTFRYAAFIWNNDIKMFEASVLLRDAMDIKHTDNETLTTYLKLHKAIYPEQLNIPEVYEEYRIFTEYKIYQGDLCISHEYTLIYYSETDAYCYVKTDYDVTTGEIISNIEDWLSPREASEIIPKF